MEPQIKKILQKFSNQKVELNTKQIKQLISEFEEIKKKSIKQNNAFDTVVDNIEKAHIDARNELKVGKTLENVFNKTYSEYTKLYSKIQSQAKELGINVNDVPMINELEKAAADAENEIDDTLQIAEYIENDFL